MGLNIVTRPFTASHLIFLINHFAGISLMMFLCHPPLCRLVPPLVCQPQLIVAVSTCSNSYQRYPTDVTGRNAASQAEKPTET